MSDPYKPDSYSSVSPYLVVENARRLIDFLEAAFDATELRRYDMPDGSIMHAELRIDDTVVMLGEGSDDFPAFSSMVHLYVPDVNAVYQRGIDAGGIPLQDPVQREGDPDRRGTVEDPEGNTWAIATQVE